MATYKCNCGRQFTARSDYLVKCPRCGRTLRSSDNRSSGSRRQDDDSDCSSGIDFTSSGPSFDFGSSSDSFSGGGGDFGGGGASGDW